MIRRMISRDPGEFREFQARMTVVGKIRLGVFATPEGQRGRPQKIDTFRFTSENEALIRAVADAYGGEVRQWTPQGSKTAEWEVITGTDAVPVYIVNGQDLDPWYEAWGGGRTCIRRCDGIINKINQELCVCIPADGKPSKLAPKDQCKPTTRAQVMLAEIPGLGSWLLESHGENAARGLSVFRDFIASAPMPVPAMLRLRHESRRQWNFEKKKFDSLDFYVPWFDISKIYAEQIAIGGDALTQALAAAGAPAIGGTPQLAIEARPVSAPAYNPRGPQTLQQFAQDGPAGQNAPAPFDIEAKRPMILADIEACTTVEALNGIRDKLIARGVDDKQVRDAWRSKVNGIGAAEVQRMNAAAIATGTGRPYRVLVTGSRTWTDVEEVETQLSLAKMTHPGRMVVVNGMCPTGADRIAFEWAERNGVPTEKHPADWSQGPGAGPWRNQAMVDSRPDIVLSFNRMESKGTEHCTAAAEAAGLKVLRFTDDTPYEPEAPERVPEGMPLKEYRVGDTVTVGGIEFTKISDNPFPPGSDAAKMFEYGNGATDGNGCFTLPDGSCASTGPCIHTPVDGTVETTGPVLPDVPDGDYDADEMYTMIMTGAGQQNPPLTTDEVNELIRRTLVVLRPDEATGNDLARLRAGLKSGAVAWR